MLKSLLSLIFSVGTATTSNKQIDKRIAEANKNGAGIWINGKKHPLG